MWFLPKRRQKDGPQDDVGRPLRYNLRLLASDWLSGLATNEIASQSLLCCSNGHGSSLAAHIGSRLL